MTASQQNLPVLRFTDRQGSDFSKWGQKKLGTITEIFDGTHQTPQYVKEGVPFYSVEQVTADQFSDTKSISEESFEQENKRVKLEEGDILMTRIGSVGVAKLINWDVRASFYVSLALIKKSPNFSSQYLVQHIKSQNFQRELWKRTIHVAFPKKINLGEIGKCIVRLPSKEEQQKIASFLSSVDTKIEQLSKKKELLELYKKGMIQKFFSQEIRFKDEQGNDYPDWEEKLLGDISNLSKGKGISKTDVKVDGTVKCIRYGELYTRYGETISNVLSSTNVPISELVLSQKNDVIIPASGETALDIASAACITVEGVAVGGDINIIRCQQNGIFLAYYLISKKIDIARLAQGVSIIHLYSAQLASLSLRIPSKQEQQKIANFLSAIDKKIELVAEQLEQARTFKKGLLQRMFI